MNNQAVIVKEVYPVPVAKVWKALTDKEQMKEWYFSIPDFVLEKDAVFNFSVGEDEKIYHHLCVITEIIPNKKFQHTWTHPEQSKGTSLVTWTLEPSANGTKLTLTHEGVESFADGGDNFKKENYIAGWTAILGTELKQFLEQ